MRSPTGSAEVLSPTLARAIASFLDPADRHLRPCFCPECRKHFTDIVFEPDRVAGVVHRLCTRCTELAKGRRP